MKQIIVNATRKYAAATAARAEQTATAARAAEWCNARMNRAEIRAEIRAERAAALYRAAFNWARR